MPFPPPIRYSAPALLLLLGIGAIWLEYQLNLANDLERNYGDVVQQADVTGRRLAKVAERWLKRNDPAGLRESLAGWHDEPWLRIAVVTDAEGVVIADSDARWAGRAVTDTPAAPAMKLASRNPGEAAQILSRQEGDVIVTGAYPVVLPPQGAGWLLVIFDRRDAVSLAYVDARRQLGWGTMVIAFFGFLLWAALHFGVAARLARLSRAVREFGAGGRQPVQTMPGGDEVHELSAAFTLMSRQLAERERERVRLEREVIESAERERRRIGHELHDGLGQHLTAALMATNAMAEALQAGGSDVATRAEHLGEQLRDTIAEVRALSHGLAPVPLWEGGLEHALQSLAESTARTGGVRCVFESPGPAGVESPEIAGGLYRIAQEAVNNALKHAAASEIRIGLERRGADVVLEVDDDGEGMPDDATRGGGIGLRVMRHRAEVLGGIFSAGAAPAGGTRVAVRLIVRQNHDSPTQTTGPR